MGRSNDSNNFLSALRNKIKKLIYYYRKAPSIQVLNDTYPHHCFIKINNKLYVPLRAADNTIELYRIFQAQNNKIVSRKGSDILKLEELDDKTDIIVQRAETHANESGLFPYQHNQNSIAETEKFIIDTVGEIQSVLNIFHIEEMNEQRRIM